MVLPWGEGLGIHGSLMVLHSFCKAIPLIDGWESRGLHVSFGRFGTSTEDSSIELETLIYIAVNAMRKGSPEFTRYS